MIDLRPVGYVIGLLVTFLGVSMAVPIAADLYYGTGNAGAFVQAGIVTVLVGLAMTLSTANGVGERLTLQQTFLIASGVWIALPLFGALPMMTGAPRLDFTNAFFEAMSGMTTTGSTVIGGLDIMPAGLLLWRSMLQWFGGIGIIVVAMVFLPELRIGGMQIFRSEAFETGGKVLPRAASIAARISVVYVLLTVVAAVTYWGLGMPGFDAVNHALTSLATGGFSTRDASFGAFQGPLEYAASIFMILAALPFVRYVQLLAGDSRPIFADSQIRAFLWVVAAVTLMLVAYLAAATGEITEASLREALFNAVSIITGTGYASVDYQLWGAFPMVLIFCAGLIGGCAGSTTCSVKMFRYQILLASIRTQIKAIHSPHGVFTPRYEGRAIGEDVISSVMAFLVIFIVTLGVVAVLLSATGLDFVTSLSGAAAAIANIGPGLGPIIGPAGNFAPLSDTAKWILIVAMLLGRLELMVVYAILTVRFWQA